MSKSQPLIVSHFGTVNLDWLNGFENTEVNLHKCDALAFDELLSGEAELILAELSSLPILLPDSIAIAGLSDRTRVGYTLLQRESNIDKQQAFGLSDKSRLYVCDELAASQLKVYCYNLDVNIYGNDHTAALAEMTTDESIAIVLPSASEVSSAGGAFAGIHTFVMQPAEVTPIPGSGVTAALCLKANLPLRRLIKKIHHSEVSACTNVERSLQKLAGSSPIAAYCHTDRSKNYHLTAYSADSSRRIQLSSVTNHKLAEHAYEQLL